MNYYPNNFYSNYPYGNTYPSMQAQPMMQQPQTLNGKVVDGEEMVKATEVPFGSYGLFPKADLSEVYVKNWNNNGTTQITVYKPVISEQESEDKVDTIALLLEKVNDIESKLDSMVSQKQPTTIPTTPTKRKELNVNAY